MTNVQARSVREEQHWPPGYPCLASGEVLISITTAGVPWLVKICVVRYGGTIIGDVTSYNIADWPLFPSKKRPLSSKSGLSIVSFD
jgi:hypothetical protein